MTIQRIAICGCTGHVGKALTAFFLDYSNRQDSRIQLFLFSRDNNKSKMFVEGLVLSGQNNLNIDFHFKTYEDFFQYDYDMILNTVGIVNIQSVNKSEIFDITETYDSMILKYLEQRNNNALYIYISSGSAAKYKNVTMAELDQLLIQPDADIYALSKVFIESRHRRLSHYAIVDLRLYSFFSRFIDTESHFLMAQVAKAVISRSIFYTSYENIIRDYIHHSDLGQLIQDLFLMHLQNKQNICIDVSSRKPISKFEIVDILERTFNINCEFSTVGGIKQSLLGSNDVYVPQLVQLTGLHSPQYTSAESITLELEALIRGKDMLK